MITQDTHTGKRLYGLYVLALAVTLIGNLVVRLGGRGDWLAAPGRGIVAVLAAAPLAVAAWLFWRLLRDDLDEMLQRIVLEAMAFALVIYLPLTALYLNLRAAGVWTPRLDPPELLLAPALLVAIGALLARRRYG